VRPQTGDHAYNESRGERRALHAGDELRPDEVLVAGPVPGPPPPGPDPRDAKIADLEAALTALTGRIDTLERTR
jgi:hypothetical protein